MNNDELIDYMSDINNLNLNFALIDVYTKDGYDSQGLSKFRCLDIQSSNADYSISLYPHHDSVALITVIKDGNVTRFDHIDIDWLRNLFLRVEDKIGKPLFDDYWLKFDDPLAYTEINIRND